jgi:hypothetical protein
VPLAQFCIAARRQEQVGNAYRRRPGPVLFTLDVDGERFAIRRAGDGGTAYDWLSWPNKGYGFASGGAPNRSVEEHRETSASSSP